MKSIRTLTALALLAGLGCAAQAGAVTVSFTNPDMYIDASTSRWDEKANLQALATHLQRLGERWLPANQSLKIEVMDVDLAGAVHPSRIDGSPLRTVRGRTDWPKVNVRYILETDGQAVRTSEEWVSDINYARGLPRASSNEPLYYEKRMLEVWFKGRFAQGNPG
ncbi:MAG: DUF3016 domain-containing protein [Pseudomonadota bacterium]